MMVRYKLKLIRYCNIIVQRVNAWNILYWLVSWVRQDSVLVLSWYNIGFIVLVHHQIHDNISVFDITAPWMGAGWSQGNERSIGSNTTVVVLLRHQHVAVISPIGWPGVLDQPVRLTIHDAVADSQHRVIQVIRFVAWTNAAQFLQLFKKCCTCTTVQHDKIQQHYLFLSSVTVTVMHIIYFHATPCSYHTHKQRRCDNSNYHKRARSRRHCCRRQTTGARRQWPLRWVPVAQWPTAKPEHRPTSRSYSL